MSFTIGKNFRMSVFGESHGKCVGVTVEGVPAGTVINQEKIQEELNRRRPGQSHLTTARNEEDRLEMISGVFRGRANGGPITMLIRNRDTDSLHYGSTRGMPRPGHCDHTAWEKYGEYHDHRGGGFFSGRMTASFVMAGAIAKHILDDRGIHVLAHVICIGDIKVERYVSDSEIEENIHRNPVRCADPVLASEMEALIRKVKEDGDSVGGMIEGRIIGVPPGVGEPLFNSVESVISHYMYSIPAVKGVDFGTGMGCACLKGSENNDPFIIDGNRVVTESNNAGGVLGGITNGMPVVFRVAIKPTPSIALPQKTVNLDTMKECDMEITGRHDPCIAIRAVPVVENLAACGILDLVMTGSR